MRAPIGLVRDNEHLVSLKEDFVSGLDAIVKEGEDDLLIDCLEDIVGVMHSEIRTDLVQCKNTTCTLQNCPYDHTKAANSASDPSDTMKRSVPFPLSDSYFEVNEPELKCSEYDIVEGVSDEEDYEDLGSSTREQVVG